MDLLTREKCQRESMCALSIERAQITRGKEKMHPIRICIGNKLTSLLRFDKFIEGYVFGSSEFEVKEKKTLSFAIF